MIDVKQNPRQELSEITPISLEVGTRSHINDVTSGMNFVADMIKDRAPFHDHTKMEHIDDFCDALKSGSIKSTEWYRKHISEERHHLKSYVPDDVNLIDVIEHLVDCTMAASARGSGEVYDTDITPYILQKAVENTVKLLQSNINIIPADKPSILDETIGI